MMELPRDGNLILIISDTGCGINEGDMAKLFKPFAQANKSIQSKYGGSGIGLWLSQKLVSAMKGDIQCSSIVGVGTTFKITIPTRCKALPESLQVRNLHLRL